MKKFLLLTSLISIAAGTNLAFASSFNLVQTKDIYTGLITFDVELDTEGKQVNAVSGTITFPRDILTIESIKTEGSIVPLWLTSPQAGKESFLFGSRGEIIFEGALPGGFDGVRSPFYTGVKSGKLFSITFRPAQEGRGLVLFSDATALLHDGNATKDNVTTNTATLQIPSLTSIPHPEKMPTTERASSQKTLDAYVITDTAIENGKYALVITNDTTKRTITSYEVAESASFDYRNVKSYEWSDAVSPYVLSYQKRNKYIHVKAHYVDATYEVITLPPVENISDETTVWRILVTIGVIALAIYVLIHTHVLPNIRKHSQKNS